MAPEYVVHGRFSVKLDVFSFGVLILEILSGKRISSFQNGENEEDLLSYVSMNIRFYITKLFCYQKTITRQSSIISSLINVFMNLIGLEELEE